MPVTVEAKPIINKGKIIKSGPFGHTTLNYIVVKKVSMVCGSFGGNDKDCACKLTGVEIEVDCLVRINPKRILHGYFDPETMSGVRGKKKGDLICPKDPKHYKLDEENVLVHEKSHASDIAEAVRKAVQKSLDKNEDDLVATCPCKQQQRCEGTLKRMVQDKIRALGKKAFKDLAKDASIHGKKSATEKTAREKQLQDLKNRKTPGECVELD